MGIVGIVPDIYHLRCDKEVLFIASAYATSFLWCSPDRMQLLRNNEMNLYVIIAPLILHGLVFIR